MRTIKKICNKCKKEKPIKLFNMSRLGKFGVRGECRECQRIRSMRVNPISARKIRGRYKKEVIDAYGGECACCGEKQIEFLTIDHMNGHDHGRKHREIVNAKGNVYYRWLRKNDFPKNLGLRVLCANCNAATSYGRICPHKRKL